MERKYFFCYSTNLFVYLKSKNHKYIVTALNDYTKNRFWLYEKNKDLENSLLEYSMLDI